MDYEEKQISELTICCEVQITIECGKCDMIQGDGDDSPDAEAAAYWFYEQGWRVTRNYVYCPKCAKNFKGNKNKKQQ